MTDGEYKLKVVAECPKSALTSEYYMYKAFFIKNEESTSVTRVDLLFMLLSLPAMVVAWKKKNKATNSFFKKREFE